MDGVGFIGDGVPAEARRVACAGGHLNGWEDARGHGKAVADVAIVARGILVRGAIGTNVFRKGLVGADRDTDVAGVRQQHALGVFAITCTAELREVRGAGLRAFQIHHAI